MTTQNADKLLSAIKIIEELLPQLKNEVVLSKEKPIMLEDLYTFVKDNGGSTRLLNVIRNGLYSERGGSVVGQWALRSTHYTWIIGKCYLYEFVDTYTKSEFRRFRGCGKLVIKELDEILRKNGVEWK